MFNYVLHYLVSFYFQYVNSFQYLRNIEMNIMTTMDENNNTIKSSILGTVNNTMIIEVHADKLNNAVISLSTSIIKVQYMTTQ